MPAIEIPEHYGYVILTGVIAPLVTNMVCSSCVMKARKKYNVQYPNLYATPGFHKQADEFNRVQRGHQNMLETITFAVACSLIGGLKYPIAVSVFSVLHSAGLYLYLVGYADTSLDISNARYQRGGVLKVIGFMGIMVSTIAQAGSLNGWW